jgi:hypothetical protein
MQLSSFLKAYFSLPLRFIFSPLCPQALSDIVVKFVNMPSCLGHYNDYNILLETECTTNSWEDTDERGRGIEELKRKKDFIISGDIELVGGFGIACAQTAKPQNVLDWGGELQSIFYAKTFLALTQSENG